MSARPNMQERWSGDIYSYLAERAELGRAQLGTSATELRPETETFLYREARLLDNLHFDEWLDLVADDCVYWVPINPMAGDPQREVSIHLHDKRRLEDYILKLRTGWAHSQIPQSRTTRLISNVEVWPEQDGTTRRVRATFTLWEYRRTVGTEVPGGREIGVRGFAGWCEYLLREANDGWLIRDKIVNLINSDAGFANPSFLL